MSQRITWVSLLTIIVLTITGGGHLLLGCSSATPEPTAVAVASPARDRTAWHDRFNFSTNLFIWPRERL